jgi:hypothetical protein
MAAAAGTLPMVKLTDLPQLAMQLHHHTPDSTLQVEPGVKCLAECWQLQPSACLLPLP